MIVGYASEWIGEQVGGVERYAVNLLRGLIEADPSVRFEVFCTQPGAERLQDLRSSRVHLHPTLSRSRWYYVPVGLPLGVRKHPVDVLHATTLVPWCPGKKVVLTIHDVGPDEHPEFYPLPIRLRYRWLVSQGLKRSDKVIVPSMVTKQELLKHYQIREDKVDVIYEGVDTVFQEAKTGVAVEDGASNFTVPADFLLYVGRFHARKNLDRLVEAFALLRRRRGSGIRLVLVGRDQYHMERTLKKIQALGLQDDVICPGYLSDTTLEVLYEKARAFLFPSVHEGFGIPPLEAMARGLPVMASNVSVMPEILGDAALLVDPKDIEGMANAMERLISDGELRELLIRRGRVRSSMYSWKDTAEAVLKLYRELIN